MIRDKIKTRDELAELCKKWRDDGKKIGFTSGSFDLIHAGHAAYLEEAKKKCDVLVVGVNSDASVKKYKGEDRPIVPEKERVHHIAAFASVDYAFLFNERRNKANLEALKPDYYIKAGDYTKDRLTSKEFVEKHGGEAVLIPLTFKTSSSDTIEKILRTFGSADAKEDGNHVHIPKKSGKKHRAIFLDRDGTINKDIDYLHEPGKFEFTPNALDGLKKMHDMEFKLAIVTNQPGIGFGYYTKEDFFRVNKEMLRRLSEKNIMVDKIYFCPHTKAGGCACRKPGTELLKRAEKDMNIDMKNSWLIGDNSSDVEAGKCAGCRTILVSSRNTKNKDANKDADYVAKDLLDAANFILKEERRL